MSDALALWILFGLLSVAFVLVVVTARRGPWQKPGSERPIIVRSSPEDIEWVRVFSKAELLSVSMVPGGLGTVMEVDEDRWEAHRP